MAVPHIVDRMEAFVAQLRAETDFLARMALKARAPEENGVTFAGTG